jgi:hypothetical protein
MAFCQVEYVDEEQEALSAKKHGAAWARIAELGGLQRLLWMDKVWRGNVLEELGPIAFAYAVNPDYAHDVESAMQLWQEMTGFQVEAWDQTEALLAFVDGVLPVARERVGDLEVEPVTVERPGDDEELEYCLFTFKNGMATGREWATTRADSSELAYLRVFRRAFQSTSGPVLFVTEYGPEILIRSFLFIVKPQDIRRPYRQIWLQLVGAQVPDPRDYDFVHGFVNAALHAVSLPVPYSWSVGRRWYQGSSQSRFRIPSFRTESRCAR